jgi:Coenzyme PQQ synthesis protein D (PqqD)
MMVPNPQAVLTRDDDGAVVLNKGSGRYFRLNPLGDEVFRRIGDGQGVPAIVAALQERFPQARDRIPADVETLLAHLRRADLVHER